MAAATKAPPQAQQRTGRTAPSGGGGASGGKSNPWDIINVSLSQLRYRLTLRAKKDLSDKLALDIGADYFIPTNEAVPVANLFYNITRNGKHFGTLDVGLNKRLTLRKPIHLARGGVSATAYLKAATTIDGVPEFGCDFDNIRPPALVAAAAVTLIALGLPLSGGKTFGNARTRIPAVSDDSVAMCGTRATVARQGRKLDVRMQELSAILRL